MIRIQFVGQAPSKETDGKPPFTGRCGAFLAQLMGTTQEKMLVDHDFLNVLNSWPGKGVGGDRFPFIEAKVAAQKMFPQLRNRIVILLGANVAKAFGMRQFRYLERYEMRNPQNLSDVVVPLMIVIPHPSGVNRYWNFPDNRMIVSKFFNEILATKT